MKNKLNCILFIDDDEPTNFLNKMVVDQYDCVREVRVLQSGQEALDYLSGNSPRPDLIFLDINMPAMDGWEFLEKYRHLPAERKADIILIMLTTSLNPDDKARTSDIPDVAGFENKPLVHSGLDDLLKRYFPQNF
jgi:CheY-like chemotaxis protein